MVIKKTDSSQALKLARIFAFIVILITILNIIFLPIKWNATENINFIKLAYLVFLSLSLIATFFIIRGLSVICNRERLLFLKKIIWTVFIVYILYGLSGIFYWNYPTNLLLLSIAMIIMFIWGIAQIIFGLSLFQLEKSYGKIISRLGLGYIILGVAFLSLLFIKSQIFLVVDTIYQVIGVIVAILTFVFFGKAIKKY